MHRKIICKVEKSKLTMEKYIRDVEVFIRWLNDEELSKEKELTKKEYERLLNTARIYTMENGDIHRMQIEKLGLLRC